MGGYSIMIICCFKNIKTGVTYEDLLTVRDINKLLTNPHIVMQKRGKEVKWTSKTTLKR